MLTFKQFTGINNILPEHRLKGSDLLAATDVDIGLDGEIVRRGGYARVADECHKNLWQGRGFLLATHRGALLATHPDGTRTTLHPAIGHSRIWYCNLPDGRTTYTNGLIHGVTDGRTGTDRTVPTPEHCGAADSMSGQLHLGQYRYCITFVRLADRLEGAPTHPVPVQITSGGLRLDGLPDLAGHGVNVYLSGLDGEGVFLAGYTTGRSFEFTGPNESLVLPCRTVGAVPFPVGTVTAFWRGRVLTAQDDTLWASRPMAPHLSDWRDFKALGSRITAICPVDDGIYVGTDEGLFFLGGDTWDKLTLQRTGFGAVVLGSGIEVPGHRIALGDGVGAGQAMLCIAGGEVVAGFAGGQTVSLTANRYRTEAREVWAAFRELPGIGPQYMALPV